MGGTNPIKHVMQLTQNQIQKNSNITHEVCLSSIFSSRLRSTPSPPLPRPLVAWCVRHSCVIDKHVCFICGQGRFSWCTQRHIRCSRGESWCTLSRRLYIFGRRSWWTQRNILCSQNQSLYRWSRQRNICCRPSNCNCGKWTWCKRSCRRRKSSIYNPIYRHIGSSSMGVRLRCLGTLRRISWAG